ncbi:MAG: DUF2723 domain-containing protein, partial [Anaerolineales bacterium]|nr:DUF2723 domain-containing protein [Anaerolineales bacterium]
MTKSSPKKRPNKPNRATTAASPLLQNRLVWGTTLSVTFLALALYVATLARYPLFGDPTEYTYVAHVLGIAHPPGYAFMTVLHKLFQTLIPFGTVAWRSHLVSALVGAGVVTAVFTTVRVLLTYAAEQVGYGLRPNLPLLAGLLTAVGVGGSVNFWQHAIHANPHLITAAFLACNLCLLTLWGVRERRTYQTQAQAAAPFLLYAFAFSTGLGVAHHPLTVFAFPAYAVFILWLRPRPWRDWRMWL